LTGAHALFAEALQLEDQGRHEEALERYRRLLQERPDLSDAWHNQGLLFARLGRFLDAEQSHRQYIAAHPRDARAYGDLADVLLALDRHEEALAALDRSLQIAPADVSSRVRRGVALACLRRFAEAKEAFASVRSSHPSEFARFVARVAPGAAIDVVLSPQNIFLSRRFAAQGRCDWAGWDEYVAEMRSTADDPAALLEPAIGFMSQHLPLDDAQRHAIMRLIAAPIEARLPPLPAPAPRQRQRIRVGVMSPDYREHLNAYLLLPLFELADRKRFEIYAYSLASDDGGPARARIRAAADAFRDLHTLSDTEAALAIRTDDVDILVDVGGHTTGGRFAVTLQRPARVQVSYLGFPSSLGSKRIDYAIVDRTAAPEGSSWSESLVHLPHTFFLYDYRSAPPPVVVSRRDYGLPEDAFVFCATHKAEKITPECFFLWMDILRAVPGSVIWFANVAPAAPFLRRAAQGCGVDPARLVFTGLEQRDRYLARQVLGDLMLDAANHNALTTACDALGMGLPVLTFGGGTAFASRAGESIVRAAGMPDLVATDRAAYVRTAVELASNQAALAAVRTRLAANRRSAPLFDTAARVRELEDSFERML
jgi:protein O-GlcNAc transferase